MNIIYDDEIVDYSIEFAAFGAAIGGGFDHSSKIIPKNTKKR